MTAKTDEPTGVNWNGATTNERERVGMMVSRLDLMLSKVASSET